jgi:hypothetical protein
MSVGPWIPAGVTKVSIELERTWTFVAGRFPTRTAIPFVKPVPVSVIVVPPVIGPVGGDEAVMRRIPVVVVERTGADE